VFYISIAVHERPTSPVITDLLKRFGPEATTGVPWKFTGVYRSEEGRSFNWTTPNERTAHRMFTRAVKWAMTRDATVTVEFKPDKDALIHGENHGKNKIIELPGIDNSQNLTVK
jgi:hypothetical protein